MFSKIIADDVIDAIPMDVPAKPITIKEILIVDDNLAYLTSTTMYLEGHGFKIKGVRTLAEAKQLLESQIHYDVIFVDYDLKNCLTGDKLVKEFNKKYLFLANSVSDVDNKRLIQAGARGALGKDLETICRLLKIPIKTVHHNN